MKKFIGHIYPLDNESVWIVDENDDYILPVPKKLANEWFKSEQFVEFEIRIGNK